MKPRYKRRLVWSIVCLLSIFVILIILIPPFIKLNHIKPYLEQRISRAINKNIKINGNINFSLIGHLSVSANDIIIPNGNINKIIMKFSYFDIFKLKTAKYKGLLIIDKANINIGSLDFNHKINNIYIKDSKLKYKNFDINISNLLIDNNKITGIFKKNNIKYNINYNNNTFEIFNKNIQITGNIYNDNSVIGKIKIDTNDISQYIDIPKIDKNFLINSDFYFDNKNNLKITNISGNEINGNIFFSKEVKQINLDINNIDIDLISILKNNTILSSNTYLKINLSGNIRINDYQFKSAKIDVYTKPNINPTSLYINNINLDSIKISKGIIQSDIIKNLLIELNINNQKTECKFYGSFNNFECNPFSFGDIHGKLQIKEKVIEANIESDKDIELDKLLNDINKNGYEGLINFNFPNVSGNIIIEKNKNNINYRFVKNKTLKELNKQFSFLPEQFMNSSGDFYFDDKDNKKFIFIPNSKRFKIEINNNKFIINGINFKDCFPNLDLQYFKDLEYSLLGEFDNNTINSLKLDIANHKFTGRIDNNHITINTKLLNLDSFLNNKYFHNYKELQFLTNEPLLIFFNITNNISLLSDIVIYKNNRFYNLIYSLKDNENTISITDEKNGSLLLNILKNNHIYDISIKLNKFNLIGNILKISSPFKVYNSIISGDINLKTFGLISYDIRNNLNGNINLIFENGIIENLGIDNFYKNANNITKINAEYFLSNIFHNNKSNIKKLKIIGKYKNGEFITTNPFELYLKHSDIYGDIKINNELTGNLQIILRGTSPSPTPINLEIKKNGKLNYLLSDIMKNFDPDFLREFINTHNKF